MGTDSAVILWVLRTLVRVLLCYGALEIVSVIIIIMGMSSCGITAGAVFYSADCPVQPIRVHYVMLVKCST